MVLSARGRAARLVLAGMIGVAALSLPLQSGAQETDSIALDAIDPGSVVAGEVIVQFRPGTSHETRDRALALVGGVFVRSLDLGDIVLAKVPAGTESAAAESLRIDPTVLAAEPNGIAQASASP